MGKVTVIIQNKDKPTSVLYEQVKEEFYEPIPGGIAELLPDDEVFIVPDDKEYPDLS